MPRIHHCDGCQRCSVIRDEMIGRKIQCDCGRVQSISDTAPYTPPPTGWLDSGSMLGCSLALLLVSLLVGGSVAAWVVLDSKNAESNPVVVVPERATPTTAKENETSEEKSEEKEQPEAEKKDPEGAKPSEHPVLRTPETSRPRTYTEKELYDRLIHSVVWIYGSDGQGAWTGSGNVIHVGRKLIVTNQHVVGDESSVQVLFPIRGSDGQWITEKNYYRDLLKQRKSQTARVLLADKRCDLAVIQLQGTFPQDTRAVKVAPRAAEPTDQVFSVGNPGVSSALWLPSRGSVRARVRQLYVNKYDKNDQIIGKLLFRDAWGLEASISINHGDSGSSLVNSRGHVIGVNVGGDLKDQSMRYAIDRIELLKVLENEKVGLNRKEVEADETLPPPSALVLDLLKQLDDSDLEICRKAVEELSRVEPFEARRAIPVLVRALQRHADAGFRRRATEELERIGPPVKEDVACLAPAMRIAYKPLRLYVLHALSQLGSDIKQAVPVLVLGLKDADGEVRQKSALMVKTLGPKARALTFEPLLKLANDSDEEVARAGLDALLELGSLTDSEIDVLNEALGDSKRRVWVRRFAAHRLGLQGEKAAKAVPTLAKVLEMDKDFNLLSLAIGALKQMGNKAKEGCAALVSLIQSHPEEKLRLEALAALEAIDLSAFPTNQMLECSLTDKSPRIRELLAKRIGTRLAELKPEQMSEFIPLFRHKEPAIVEAGLKIVLMKKRDAGPIAGELANLTKHPEARIRRMAFEILQAVGPAGKEAVPSLLAMHKEAAEAERLPLAVLLGSIAAKDGKIVEVVLPDLLAGLHPRGRKPGAPTLTQINKVLVAIGQPAVDAIFKRFETLSYRGKDNIDYREELFKTLAGLGPGCRSQDNYRQVKLLRDKEKSQGYPKVLAAVSRALKAMDAE